MYDHPGMENALYDASGALMRGSNKFDSPICNRGLTYQQNMSLSFSQDSPLLSQFPCQKYARLYHCCLVHGHARQSSLTLSL